MKDYILSSPFPNFISSLWIIALILMHENIILLFLCLIFLVLSQIDALSRFREFKRSLIFFKNNGIRYSFVKAKMHSRCQRDAVLYAAKKLKLHEFIQDFYRKMGYRWYHIIPDEIIKNPLFLLSSKFWKTFWIKK